VKPESNSKYVLDDLFDALFFSLQEGAKVQEATQVLALLILLGYCDSSVFW
jgi:hypothetical protein